MSKATLKNKTKAKELLLKLEAIDVADAVIGTNKEQEIFKAIESSYWQGALDILKNHNLAKLINLIRDYLNKRLPNLPQCLRTLIAEEVVNWAEDLKEKIKKEKI